MQMTTEMTQQWLNAFTKAIEENKGYLSDLDTPIGDGDHGNNMAPASQPIKKHLQNNSLKQSQTHSKYSRWH